MGAITLSRNTVLIDRVAGKLGNAHTREAYRRAMCDFLAWHEQLGRPGLNAALLRQYLNDLKHKGLGSSAINQRLAAIRHLIDEAKESGVVSPILANEVKDVKGEKQRGERMGKWLSQKEAQALLRAADTSTLKGLRDRAILACFLGCGLRRSEMGNLNVGQIQRREGRWVLLDIKGKGGRVRTIPMPGWCKEAIDAWTKGAKVTEGYLFRAISKGGEMGKRLSARALHNVVAAYADISPHDLRRTHAKLAYQGGAHLDQIQLTLGHASIATTERYLGTELELHNAPGDHLGLRL